MEIKTTLRGGSVMPARQRGVTMIELMVVIAIVAIIASIAIPSYQEYVLRTNRSDAINQVLEIAACQERIYIKENRYDTGRCGLVAGTINSPNNRYIVTMALNRGGLGDQSFTLTAAPQPAQADDSCGTMTLDDLGGRQAALAGTDEQTDRCWQGRSI